MPTKQLLVAVRRFKKYRPNQHTACRDWRDASWTRLIQEYPHQGPGNRGLIREQMEIMAENEDEFPGLRDLHLLAEVNKHDSPTGAHLALSIVDQEMARRLKRELPTATTWQKTLAYLRSTCGTDRAQKMVIAHAQEMIKSMRESEITTIVRRPSAIPNNMEIQVAFTLRIDEIVRMIEQAEGMSQ